MHRSLEEIQADFLEQAQEIYAIECIYGEENITHYHNGKNCIASIYVPSIDGPHITLKVTIPPTYPSSSAPTAEISAPYLSDDLVNWANKELKSLYRPGVREHILFTWIEWLKDQPELQPPPVSSVKANEDHYIKLGKMLIQDDHKPKAADKETEDSKAKGKGKESTSTSEGKENVGDASTEQAQIFHGKPFTEQKSTFQAHLAPAKTVKDVKNIMDTLLENSKIQKATHNIMAYRIQTNQGTYLQVAEAVDVCVVVSRWFGGVLLGPSRFTHINNAARTLLDVHGYIRKEENKSRKVRK